MENVPPAQLAFLLNLYFTKYNHPNRPATLSQFITEQGARSTELAKRTLLQGLINEGVLVHVGTNGLSFDLYYLSRKVLKQVIEAQELVQAFSRYKKETAILWD